MTEGAGYEIRAVSADQASAFFRTTWAAFGAHPEEEDLTVEAEVFFPERSLAAFDGGRIVATAGSFPFELTLPGGRFTPMGGVSYVGVLPTHRRRGLLTAMMRRQLDDFRAAGEAVAGLTASESAIYGRFGYGLATATLEIELEKRHGVFRQPVVDTGRCVMLDKDDAAKVVPALYDRIRRGRVGELNRFDRYWIPWFADRKNNRPDGFGARFYVVHESAAGEPDGYVAYRVKEAWPGGLPHHTLRVDELRAAGREPEAALWRFVLDVDLVGRVQSERHDPADPLSWMLVDARRLRVVNRHDHLWIRLVDLPTALEARAYGSEDELVLDVADDFCPWNAGVWRLAAGPDGASCTRAAAGGGADADLTLDAQDLGAVYLGGVPVSTLVRAGRVVERRPGAAARADALFRAEQLPWCTTGF